MSASAHRRAIAPRYDVVVLGSGAAGLTAALAASHAGAAVAVFEKAHVVGGTTAMSGGVAWLPNNPVAAREGIEDNAADALRYLASLSNGSMHEAGVRAFVETVPELVDWLERDAGMTLRLCTIPDYHPEHPGARPRSGRSLESELVAFSALGEWADHVATGQYSDPETGDVYMMSGETPRGGGSGKLNEDEARRRRVERVNGRGRALAGGLLKACLEAGVDLHRLVAAKDLVRTDGRITGVTIEVDGVLRTVEARRGVIIATGGFEWDADLVKAFLRGPMAHPTSIPTNTGDGLRMAMKQGAMLGTMREAWWVPVLLPPGKTGWGHPRTSLVLRERSLPGAVMVNQTGRRFCNEAGNYNALGGAFHQLDPNSFTYANLPCWLVFDQAYWERYGLWELAPGSAVPDWIARGETPQALAEAIAVDADGLADTLGRWNDQVAAGSDDDFHRGDSAYDGWNGDISHYPDHASTLGSVAIAPFYAVELHSSTLGTKGGPMTDVDGAVIDVDGRPIAGLYAAGNAAAGVTGMAYGGAGGTLGPAMVFGYRAGRKAAAERPNTQE